MHRSSLHGETRQMLFMHRSSLHGETRQMLVMHTITYSTHLGAGKGNVYSEIIERKANVTSTLIFPKRTGRI